MSDLQSTNQPEQITKPESKLKNKQKIRLILTTILAILLGTFIYQNFNKVEIEFLVFTFRVRIVLIIFFSALIGGLITYLLMKQRASRKRKK
jgi:uncharacterized integral membrane protein